MVIWLSANATHKMKLFRPLSLTISHILKKVRFPPLHSHQMCANVTQCQPTNQISVMTDTKTFSDSQSWALVACGLAYMTPRRPNQLPGRCIFSPYDGWYGDRAAMPRNAHGRILVGGSSSARATPVRPGACSGFDSRPVTSLRTASPNFHPFHPGDSE